MAAQLKDIVEKLNGEPFCLDLSLVSFDDKDPQELMDILTKVLVYMDPKHDVDTRDEKPEAMYQRVAEFLHIVGYQCCFDSEFQQGLMAVDKGTVHPILYWLLNNLDSLKKRAYLAKFCMNFEVPEEYLRDEQVYQQFMVYKDLQSSFKVTHSHLEQERNSRMNPMEYQREVGQLDGEREQLSQKIQTLKSKSDKEPGFQQLLQVTSMLRKEQEEEARLNEKLMEQRYQLDQVEQMYFDRSKQLKEMREASQKEGEGGAEMMLNMLRNEVNGNRDKLGRITRDNDEKMQRLQEVDRSLSDVPVTQADIDQLEGDIQSMQAEVASLEGTVSESTTDPRLSVYKQQQNLVAKRKEDVLGEQNTLQADVDEASRVLSQKEREYETVKGHKFMKRDQFKVYAASLRDKSAKFKRLKAELSELKHEVAVLLRTEQLLQAKDPTPAGLRETEAALEKASVEKSQVDKAKGKTLDDITNTVTRINTQLKEKKNKLAPQIKALRSVRQNFQQVEIKYTEKRGEYERAKSSVDGELTKLVEEVKALQNQVLEREQEYHILNMQMCTLDSKQTRAHREARCAIKEERHSAEFQTLTDEYASQIAQLDEQCQELRKEQQFVKDSQQENVKQKKAFVQLERLMQLKLKVAKQESQGLPYGGMQQARTMIDESTPGIQRLVME